MKDLDRWQSAGRSNNGLVDERNNVYVLQDKYTLLNILERIDRISSIDVIDITGGGIRPRHWQWPFLEICQGYQFGSLLMNPDSGGLSHPFERIRLLEGDTHQPGADDQIPTRSQYKRVVTSRSGSAVL